LFKVAFAVIAVIVVLAFAHSMISGALGWDRAAASERAEEYSSRMYKNHGAIECMKFDTDGDGYFSCSVQVDDSIENIECPGWLTFNDGCRQPKFRVSGR
jgi:hypothetical protein